MLDGVQLELSVRRSELLARDEGRHLWHISIQGWQWEFSCFGEPIDFLVQAQDEVSLTAPLLFHALVTETFGGCICRAFCRVCQ